MRWSLLYLYSVIRTLHLFGWIIVMSREVIPKGGLITEFSNTWHYLTCHACCFFLVCSSGCCFSSGVCVWLGLQFTGWVHRTEARCASPVGQGQGAFGQGAHAWNCIQPIQVEPGKPGAEVSKKKTISQRKNLPIECAQGDQPLRCPNRVSWVKEPSAVPWWWCCDLFWCGWLQGAMK